MIEALEFYDLFAGRIDRIGNNVQGKERSVHTSSEEDVINAVSLHLTDPDAPIAGIYPVGPDRMTRWGCFDFDAKTSSPHEDALDCLHALQRVGLHGYIEVSRSGDGRHVWVFAEAPVPAITMRKALLFIDAAAELDCNEINPKQRLEQTDFDYSTAVGNYVRLPYHAGHETMKVVDVDTAELLDLGGFLSVVQRSSVAQLSLVASRYRPQPPARREVPLQMGNKSVRKEPTQDAELILRGGLVEHGGGFVDGRDNKLWNLACYMARHPGYSLEDAEAVMIEIHHSGQLVQDPDFIPVSILIEKARRAFSQT